MKRGKRFFAHALAISIAGGAVGCVTPTVQQGHQYGDLEAGFVDDRFRDGWCEAGELADLLEPYMRPEMMAIGDSLYNGVRALRVNWWLAEWSAPAMTAMALGLIEIDQTSKLRTGERQFYVPRYPGHPAYHGGEGASPLRRDDLNIGIDLESLSIRQINSLLRAQSRTLKDWASRSFSSREGRPVNDNLAFFGADATDLLTLTDARSNEIMSRPLEHANGRSIAELRDAIAEADEIGIRDLTGSLRWIGDAAFYGNAGFVLNPLALDCLARMSAIDQVVAREPRRLLVSIGANHGIYRVGFDGYDIDMPIRKLDEHGEVVTRTIRQELGQVFLARMGIILDRLAEVKRIQYVYINTLPRPSYAANLMPANRSAWPRRAPGFQKYYPKYTPYLTFSGHRELSAEQVEEADLLVRHVNEELRKLLDKANAELGNRKFVLVEIDQLLDRYDAKHTGNRKDGLPVRSSNRLLSCTTYLTNLPLAPAPGGTCDIEFSRGGIFGMDNMHLSTPGYGALADLVANTVAQAEGIQPSLPGAEVIKPQELFGSDALKENIFLRNATTLGGNLAAAGALAAHAPQAAAFVRRAILREAPVRAVPASPVRQSSAPSG